MEDPHDPARSRPGYADPAAGKLVAPAAARNAGPIAETLARLLAGAEGTVLEVAAGTGQHAVACAAALPRLDWLPTDPDPAHLASIAAWRAEAGPANLLAPRPLDARSDWGALPGAPFRAVFCANMIHIAPWAAAEGLAAGAARVLAPGGLLILYGPFDEGAATAESNRAFDASLRARDPAWGLRPLTEVAALAARHGFGAPQRIAMPANNLILAFPH